MNFPLKEGQVFANRLTLLHPLAESDASAIWLALDSGLNERVDLKLFKKPLDTSARNRLLEAVDSLKGLVHPNIVRIYQAGQHEGLDYVSSQHINAVNPFDVTSDLESQWPTLSRLFDALEYAHSLGLVHGHLHPGNLLINDQGEPLISDFGLPSTQAETGAAQHYLSPQIRQGHSPDITDDIYSIGQLLYHLLTKKFWDDSNPDFESDFPVPSPIVELVTRMLSSNPYDRPASLSLVRENLEAEINPEPHGNLIASSPQAFRPHAHANEPANTAAAALSADPLPTDDGDAIRKTRTLPASTALTLLVALVVMAMAFFTFIPSVEVEKPAGSAESLQEAVAGSGKDSGVAQQDKTQQQQTPAPFEIARLQRLKEEGKELADNLIRLQLKLERKGVQVWAAEEYQQTMVLAQEGDDFYRDDNYQEAFNKYIESRDMLQGLETSMETVLSDQQAKGEQALLDGDPQAALAAFTIVTAITPDDPLAKKQLLRAENLEQVIELTSLAKSHESSGNDTEALKVFRQVRELDPLWLPAANSIERINRNIAGRRFSDAMSKGFSALEKKQYQSARRAFKKAQTILPGSHEPRDGLTQVEVAEHTAKVERLQASARQSEQQEDWQAAFNDYDELIALDNSLAFAHAGKEKSRKRLEVDQSLQKYIDHPEIMNNDEELSAARKAIYTASKLEKNGNRLKAQLDRLSRLISQARIPVPLRLRSDNRTEVTVYKIDQLGRFSEKELLLVPGRYTIVGKRRGYQDVQKKVTLLAGYKDEPLYISCTEKI